MTGASRIRKARLPVQAAEDACAAWLIFEEGKFQEIHRDDSFFKEARKILKNWTPEFRDPSRKPYPAPDALLIIFMAPSADSATGMASSASRRRRRDG
jgi:hypothetical protein